MTVAIAGSSNLPVVRMVVLEALAVNAGSTLSPIGNPQNLLLWQHSQLSFGQFAWGMFPAAATMLTLVVALALYWMPQGRLALTPADTHAPTPSRRLGAWSLLALLVMVLAMEYDRAIWGAALLLVAFAVCVRSSLRRVDWALLLTFAAIFVGLGHVAELPIVRSILLTLDFNRPLCCMPAGSWPHN